MGDHTSADMDGGWKQLLDDYLAEFLRFFFPRVHAAIDFDRQYESLDKELAVDPSPLAVASLVQLGKMQAGGDVRRRLDCKLALARELYRRAYEREDVLKLFRFMDYVLPLPAELSRQFDSELEEIEERLNMPYITSIERNALQRGIEQGIEQGIAEGIEKGRQEGQREGILPGVRDLLHQTLEIRFGELPVPLAQKIEQCADVVVLRALHPQALTACSIDE